MSFGKSRNSHIKAMKRPSNDKIIEVLNNSAGLISHAAKKLGVDRRTVYMWISSDPDLKLAVEEVRENIIDMVEAKMFNEAQNGNTTILIFLAKTIGRNRGYVEKQEIEQTTRVINVGYTKNVDEGSDED